MTDGDIIQEIIEREGDEFTDGPLDHGGPTRYGITQATLAQWRGREVSVDEVRNLSATDAAAIYYARYVREPGFIAITDRDLRGQVVDIGVNSGPVNAIRMLQRACGVADDGVFGPVTIAAANAMVPRVASIKLGTQRARFYCGLVQRDPTQAAFIVGWMNRAMSFIEAVTG